MQKLTLATLSTLALTLACTQVFALDGTLTVNGAVTDQTCTDRDCRCSKCASKN